MKRGRYGIMMGLMLLAGAVGCAPPQPKLQRDLEVMKRESAPAQLEARGEMFAAAGDMTRAEQYFVAALRSGGSAGQLVRRLVAVCVSDGRYPAALEYAVDYIRKHPGDMDVRFAAATLKRALGDAEGARKDLHTVLQSEVRIAEAHYALAQLERDEGNVMVADAEFREYLRMDPHGAHAEEARGNLMRTVP